MFICSIVLLLVGKIPFLPKNLKWAKQQQTRARTGNHAAVFSAQWVLPSPFPLLNTPSDLSDFNSSSTFSEKLPDLPTGQISLWEALTALRPHCHSSCHSGNFTTAFLFKLLSLWLKTESPKLKGRESVQTNCDLVWGWIQVQVGKRAETLETSAFTVIS